MSASPQHERPASGAGEEGTPASGARDERTPASPATGDTEEIDALPVLADAASVVRSYPLPGELSRGPSVAMLPAVQAAAVAAGGFVAGAAVVGLVTRRRQSDALAKGRRAGRRLGRSRRARKSSSPAGELVQIVGSRSLLLDVHLLGGRD